MPATSLRIAELHVSNFKSIPPKGVVVHFDSPFAVFAGKNNAGKSNLLEALHILIGPKNPLYVEFPLDVYNDPTNPIVLEVTIAGVSYGTGKYLGLSDKQCHSISSGKGSGTIVLRHTVMPSEPSPAPEEPELVLGDQSGVPPSEDEAALPEEKPASFEMLLAGKYPVHRSYKPRERLFRVKPILSWKYPRLVS